MLGIGLRISPELRPKLYADLARAARPGVLAYPGLFATFWLLSPSLRALGVPFWGPAAAVVVLTATRLATIGPLATSPEARNHDRRFRAYVVQCLVSAVAWACGTAMCLGLYGLNEATYVLLLATAGICAGSLSTLGILLELFIAYVVLVLAPPFVVLVALSFQGAAPAVLPVMFLVFGAFFVSIGTRTSRAYATRFEALVELDRARTAAERLSDQKTRFFAAVSHELRTPLNGIIGVSSLLAESEATLEQQDLLQVLDQSSQALLRITNDVLDLTRARAGRLDLSAAPFDVATTLDEAVDALAPLAEQAGLELVPDVAADLPLLAVGDSGRLRQIVTNLVHNAIKFTTKGQVRLRATTPDRGATLRVEVIDTGPGIPEDEQARLFEAFVQADEGRRRGRSGSGLGLAIVRELVEAMTGRIGVESAVGSGSTFWLEVPLSIPTAGGAPVTPPVVTPPTRGPARVADPDPERRRGIEQALLRAGHAVRPGADEWSALAATEEAEDHFVSLDTLSDPTVEAILQAPQSPHAVLVLVPARLRNEARLRLGTRVEGVLRRPVTQRSLRQRDGLSTPPASVPSVGSRRVLVVDDSAPNRAITAHILRGAGYEVETVEDGESALARCAEATFDAILMDASLGDLDGPETTRRMRAREADEGRPPTPILAMTADVRPEAERMCLGAGMNAFLVKPVHPEELRTVLAAYVGLSSPPRPTGT